MKIQLTRLKPSLLTAVAAVALAACAGSVTVSRDDVATSYQPEELYVVGTGENELRTVVVGEPYDMPKGAFQTAVLKSLDGRHFGPRLNLSTNPKRVDVRKRHVVLAFNPTTISQTDELCSGETLDTAKVIATGGSLTVTAVYCSGDHYLTQATASLGGVPDSDSAQFRALMTQLAIALFPSQNPHSQLDESCPKSC
jgi:hypothetical protein